MIKVKYDSWEKISVNVFEKLNNAINDAEVTGNNEVDLLNKQIAILSVLCDVDEDTIADLHTSEFSRLVNETNFLNETPKKNVIDKITLNGKKYEIFLSISDMTMSQYIDFQTLFPKRDKEFKRILSIFVIPKGCNYNEGYDIEQVIKDIGDYMPITDANNIMFFFALAYQSLTKVMLTSLVKEMKKLKKKEKDQAKVEQMQLAIDQVMTAKHLVENGDGFIM
jgi:hypothetical protein